MKRKVLIILSVVLCGILLCAVLYYNFYYSYEVIDENNWQTRTIESNYEDREPVNLELTEKDAVKIADRLFRDMCDRKYFVYYDKKINCYCVVSRYTETRHNWFQRNSEWECTVLVNKRNGAVLDFKIVSY